METKNKLPTDKDHCADGPHGHEGCEGRHVGRGQADQAHGHQQWRRHRFPTKHVAEKILKFKQACFKFLDGGSGDSEKSENTFPYRIYDLVTIHKESLKSQ